MNHTVIVIPARNPELQIVKKVRELKETGYDQIVVVNDGSSREYDAVFQQCAEAGCAVERHIRTRGAGAAIKTGIWSAVTRYDDPDIAVIRSGGDHPEMFSIPAALIGLALSVEGMQEDYLVNLTEAISAELTNPAAALSAEMANPAAVLSAEMANPAAVLSAEMMNPAAVLSAGMVNPAAVLSAEPAKTAETEAGKAVKAGVRRSAEPARAGETRRSAEPARADETRRSAEPVRADETHRSAEPVRAGKIRRRAGFRLPVPRRLPALRPMRSPV